MVNANKVINDIRNYLFLKFFNKMLWTTEKIMLFFNEMDVDFKNIKKNLKEFNECDLIEVFNRIENKIVLVENILSKFLKNPNIHEYRKIFKSIEKIEELYYKSIYIDGTPYKFTDLNLVFQDNGYKFINIIEDEIMRHACYLSILAGKMLYYQGTTYVFINSQSEDFEKNFILINHKKDEFKHLNNIIKPLSSKVLQFAKFQIDKKNKKEKFDLKNTSFFSKNFWLEIDKKREFENYTVLMSQKALNNLHDDQEFIEFMIKKEWYTPSLTYDFNGKEVLGDGYQLGNFKFEIIQKQISLNILDKFEKEFNYCQKGELEFITIIDNSCLEKSNCKEFLKYSKKNSENNNQLNYDLFYRADVFDESKVINIVFKPFKLKEQLEFKTVIEHK